MTREASLTRSLPFSSLVGTLREYAIFTLDTDGIIDSWNAGVGELLGYEQHEFVGQPGSIIFTAEDRADKAVEHEMAVALEAGEAMDDRWHVRKDGSRFWANGIMHAVRGDDGDLKGFLKLMRDQTEKLLAEEHLRSSEERFTTVFKNNPSPLAILSLPDMRIADLNDTFTDKLGFDRTAAIGGTPQEIGIELAAGELDKVREATSADRPARSEASFRRPDGSRGYGTLEFMPVQVSEQAHAVMLVHDVTDWRVAQDLLEQQRRLIAAILDSLPGLFYMFDGRRLVRWNDEALNATGYSSEELAALAPEELVVSAEKMREHLDLVAEKGQASLEGNLRTKDGSQVPYLFTSHRVQLDGTPAILGLGIEIREQVRSRQILERRAHEQSAFAELASSSLSNDDVQPTLDLAVKRVSEVLGADRVHVAEFGENGVVVRASSSEEGSPPGDLAPLGMRSAIQATVRGLGKTFGYIEALSERDNAFTPDDMSFLDSVAYLLANAVEQHRLHSELQHRAEYDHLTGLLNRVAFERRLTEALARAERQGKKVAVLFVDLDRFKAINDTFGHLAGDEVLRNVAKRFRDIVRSWDLIARHGGDEFVLCLPDIDSRQEISHITGRLLNAFREPFTVDGRLASVGGTIGVAVYPDDGADTDTLLRAADSALYKGKAGGRNTTHFFTRKNASS